MREAGRAVGDAGVFVNGFEGGEKPDLAFLDRPADGANVVLPREGLLGVGRGIVDRETRIQACGTLVKRAVAMPLVGSAFRDNHHGAGGGASRVRIFLRGAHREFLDGFRREVLQKPADVIIGIVRAIHRKLNVQTGTPTEGNGGDARLGGIGGLYRLSSGNEIGDIGKAASCQRDVLEILCRDGALMHGARGVDGLRRDRRGLALDIHALGESLEPHCDRDALDHADDDRDVRAGFGKSVGVYDDLIVARW